MKLKPYRLTALLLLAMTAAMIAWQLSGTDWVDDWNYKLMPESFDGFWHCTGEPVTTWTDAAKASAAHHAMTTPRLPNYLQTFSNLIPPWVTRTLHGLTLALAFALAALAAGGKRIFRSPGLCALLWLTLWTVLPLHDFMISSDFAFNYFWPTSAILLFTILFSGSWQWLPWPRKRLMAIFAMATAIIAGTMHEGVTLPVAAGCVVAIIVDPDSRRYRIAMTAVLTVTALLFFLNSGMMERISQHVTDRDNTYLKYMAVNLIIESHGLIFAIAALAIAAIKKGRSLGDFVKDNVLLLTAFVGTMVIAWATMLRGRALWFADLFGIILFFRAVWAYFPLMRRPLPAVGIIVGAILCFLIGSVAAAQRRFTKEAEQVERHLATTRSPIAFIDFRSPNMSPWWLLGVAQSITDGYANSSLTMFYLKESHPYTIMLPSSMASADPDSWEKHPGNSGLSGRYPFLAGRNRLRDNSGLLLTFGEPTAEANPLYSLINMVRRSSEPILYPVEEWPVIYRGDTLWCYSIGQVRRLDRNREIIRIDTIP